MSDKNLFEIAARKGYRFPSTRGELTTEQLFDLKLTGGHNAFDLNNIAMEINRQLKSLTEESFVHTKPTPYIADLTNKLDLVKYIINTKLEEQAKARRKAEKAAEREKLVQLLADKEDESLKNLSADEIRAKLAETDDEE